MACLTKVPTPRVGYLYPTWTHDSFLTWAEYNNHFLSPPPPQKIQRTNILCLSNSKTLSKVWHHLLTSLKVNDVTKLASHDDICNETLTAKNA